MIFHFICGVFLLLVVGILFLNNKNIAVLYGELDDDIYVIREYIKDQIKNITSIYGSTTFEEFKEFIENASHNDSDFIKIYNFYNNKLE